MVSKNKIGLGQVKKPHPIVKAHCSCVAFCQFINSQITLKDPFGAPPFLNDPFLYVLVLRLLAVKDECHL